MFDRFWYRAPVDVGLLEVVVVEDVEVVVDVGVVVGATKANSRVQNAAGSTRSAVIHRYHLASS